MPVMGLSINKYEANRKKGKPDGELKINSTPKILDVKEVNVPALNKKALSMDFEFETKYDPEVGDIKIGGNIIYMPEDLKKVMKEWKEKKRLLEEVSIEVLNHLFRRMLIKVAILADDLQLPPPIQLPRVKKKSDQADYIG